MYIYSEAFCFLSHLKELFFSNHITVEYFALSLREGLVALVCFKIWTVVVLPLSYYRKLKNYAVFKLYCIQIGQGTSQSIFHSSKHVAVHL